MGSRVPLLWPELRKPLPIGDRQESSCLSGACWNKVGRDKVCKVCTRAERDAFPETLQRQQAGRVGVCLPGRTEIGQRGQALPGSLQLRARVSQGRAVLPGWGGGSLDLWPPFRWFPEAPCLV